MPCRLLHVIPGAFCQAPFQLDCMYGRTFLAWRPTLESGADSATLSTQAPLGYVCYISKFGFLFTY